jgi:hypothetical protein
MMKKLLCLVLVLAMGSLATAGLQLVVIGPPQPLKPSDVFTVVLVNDTVPLPTIPPMGGVSADLTFATVAGPAVIYDENIPGSWTIEEYGMDPAPIFYWTITNTQAGVGGIAAGADILSITLHCEGKGPVLIQIWDSSFENVLAETIVMQIPEPASMLLLGLGGLFLRRK